LDYLQTGTLVCWARHLNGCIFSGEIAEKKVRELQQASKTP